MAKQKDLNAPLVKKREVMTRVKKDDEDEFVTNGKFDGLLETIYVPTKEELDKESDEMFDNLLDNNLDDFARREGIVVEESEFMQKRPKVKFTNPLDNLVHKIVSAAMSQGLLELGWSQDNDYIDAIIELVQKNGNYGDDLIKQSIKKLYG